MPYPGCVRPYWPISAIINRTCHGPPRLLGKHICATRLPSRACPRVARRRVPTPRRPRARPTAARRRAPPRGAPTTHHLRTDRGDDAATRPDARVPPARLDGRRAHVLDRAAEYLRLADQGLTAAQIARRRRKSPAHVSILLRLGRALAALPDDERAALRHPRVTWRLVQRLVRTDVDPGSLRRQLRAAVGGFSTHTVDRRRRRPAPDATASPTNPAPSAAGVAWGWDAAWFARDPQGYAAAHLAYLTHLHHVVAARATQAVRARQAAALAGEYRRRAEPPGAAAEPRPPPRAARARGRRGAGPTPAEQDALATFAAVGAALAGVPTGVPTPEATPASPSGIR